MMGGKFGHGRHFPKQAHHGKHDDGHGKHDDKNNKMGMWQRGRGGKIFAVNGRPEAEAEEAAGPVEAGTVEAGALATSAKGHFART